VLDTPPISDPRLSVKLTIAMKFCKRTADRRCQCNVGKIVNAPSILTVGKAPQLDAPYDNLK
jgi:hypothetical protein